jgi:hypothetical protein
MNAALIALSGLLEAAAGSGFIKDGAAASNPAISIRQQLQQAMLMQQLTGVMSGLAADLRSEAAALKGWGRDELCADVGRFRISNTNLSCLATLNSHLSLTRSLVGSSRTASPSQQHSLAV